MTISDAVAIVWMINDELKSSLYLCIFFGGSIYFFERSTTIESLYYTILFERYHTICDCCFIDDSSTCSINNQFFDTGSNFEDFIDTDTTLIPYIFTFCTADSFIKYRISEYICGYSRKKFLFCGSFQCFFHTSFQMRIKIIHRYSFFALLTELANETLGDNSIDRSWKKKCGNPHVQYSREGLSGRVRMDRRYYEVTSKSCFDCNIYRFMISYFSYHDDVRILTKSST